MTRFLFRLYSLSFSLLVFFSSAEIFADTAELQALLKCVEQRNLQLKAAEENVNASNLERAAENVPGGTSVEYSPFFQKGTSGVATSELIVTQEFDFPTLYAARAKVNAGEAKALSAQYSVLRRDLMVQAATTYVRMVALNREYSLLARRDSISGALLSLFERRLSLGDATALDVNRLKMENMDIRNAVVQNRSDYSVLRSVLATLCGDEALPLTIEAGEYPYNDTTLVWENLKEDFLSNDADTKAAVASLSAATRNLEASRQSWLPSIMAGYRRNTELNEAFNGFVVGASFSLFESGKKVKAAQSRLKASQLELDDTRVRAQNEVTQTGEEFDKILEMMKLTDTALLEETLVLMEKAVDAGQMSAVDYCREATQIYTKLLDYNALEARLYQTIVLLRKNSL